GDALEQGADALVAFVRWRLQVVPIEAEFFVLGADAPSFARFFTGGDAGDEIVDTRDGSGLGMAGDGHRAFLGEGDRFTVGAARVNWKGAMSPVRAVVTWLFSSRSRAMTD